MRMCNARRRACWGCNMQSWKRTKSSGSPDLLRVRMKSLCINCASLVINLFVNSYIAMLAVSSTCRKHGIGSHLVSLAVNRMVHLGCDEVSHNLCSLVQFFSWVIQSLVVFALSPAFFSQGDIRNWSDKQRIPQTLQSIRFYAWRGLICYLVPSYTSVTMDKSILRGSLNTTWMASMWVSSVEWWEV